MLDVYKLLQSSNYKERFQGEYYQLKDRVEKLGAMLEKWDRGELNFEPTTEKEVLKMQLQHMQAYLAILKHRAEKEEIEIDF